MLLDEIARKWHACRSDVQREIIWSDLVRPDDGNWFRCFREMATPETAFILSLVDRFEAWLDGVDATAPTRFCNPGFSSSTQQRLLRACYQLALQTRASQGASPPAADINAIADNDALSWGLVTDLAGYISGRELRAADYSIQLTALLIDGDQKGVPAMIKLEYMTRGTGAFYPAPWLAFCRDEAFMQAERLAESTVRATDDIDIRWSLKRCDGKPLGLLTGGSMAGALALGLDCLLNKPAEIDPGYLARVAVTAALDKTGRFNEVGGLWNKLDLEAMQLAALHTVIASKEQNGIPPRYLSEDASPMVLQARDTTDAISQLQQKSIAWRAIRAYERKACEKLEFRLPGTKAPIETHYKILPLYSEIEVGEDIHTRDQAAADLRSAQPGVILRWENAVRSKNRDYRSVTLDEVIGRTQPDISNCPPRLLVLGTPGSGKTTLIQYLAWAAATDSLFQCSLVPARIRLRDWELWARANPGTGLHDFLSFYYQSRVQHAPGTPTWRNWLIHGRVALLLDGVDEIEDAEWFRQRLQELLDYQQTALILTTRTVAFRLYEPQFEAFTVYWLGPLSKPQRDAYIHAYPARLGFDRDQLIDQLDNNATLRDFAQNPLLLSIICFVLDDQENHVLPETHAALYSRFVDSLLARPTHVPVNYPGVSPPDLDKKRIIAHAALRLLGEHHFSFTADDLNRALCAGLTKNGYGSAPAPWAHALAKDLVANSALVRGYRDRSNRRDKLQFFLHAMIQEYLAAYGLLLRLENEGCDSVIEFAGKQVSIRALISELAWNDPHWIEVVRLLDEMLENGTSDR